MSNLKGTGSAGTKNVELIEPFSLAFGHFPIHFPHGTIPSQTPRNLVKFLFCKQSQPITTRHATAKTPRRVPASQSVLRIFIYNISCAGASCPFKEQNPMRWKRDVGIFTVAQQSANSASESCVPLSVIVYQSKKTNFGNHIETASRFYFKAANYNMLWPPDVTTCAQSLQPKRILC